MGLAWRDIYGKEKVNNCSSIVLDNLTEIAISIFNECWHNYIDASDYYHLKRQIELSLLMA